jgi:hypothetical protein
MGISWDFRFDQDLFDPEIVLSVVKGNFGVKTVMALSKIQRHVLFMFCLRKNSPRLSKSAVHE